MADLFFIYGAMGAGKSTDLLMKAYDYEKEGKKVFLIKPIRDDKGDEYIVNRIGMKRKVDYLVKHDDNLIRLVSNLISKPKVIFVDEAQFLEAEQINQLFLISKDFDITVYAYGIRSDFRQNEFTGSARLFTIADNIQELNQKICNCGNKATQNLRLFNGVPTFDGESIVIDHSKDEDNKDPYSYKSVCGNCYIRIRRKYSNEDK